MEFPFINARNFHTDEHYCENKQAALFPDDFIADLSNNKLTQSRDTWMKVYVIYILFVL